MITSFGLLFLPAVPKWKDLESCYFELKASAYKYTTPTDSITILEPENCLSTNLFTFLEFQDQEIGEVYVVQERRATDFEAPKL